MAELKDLSKATQVALLRLQANDELVVQRLVRLCAGMLEC
jgi:hypothetical protein